MSRIMSEPIRIYSSSSFSADNDAANLIDPAKLRRDYFIRPDLQLYQNRKQFCINSDSAALALFCPDVKGKRVLEIGCNNGALLLYLDQFYPESLTGIELQPSPAALAACNLQRFATSPWQIVQQDAAAADLGEFDLVLCNPPYFDLPPEKSAGSLSSKEIARFETSLSLDDLCACARRHLGDHGRFVLVHRPDRLTKLFQALSSHELWPDRLQIVYDARTAQAKAVLVEAIVGARPDLVIEEPLWYDGSPCPKKGLSPAVLWKEKA